MKFKALEGIRKVRDEEYEETKKMLPKEKIEYQRKGLMNSQRNTLKVRVRANGIKAQNIAIEI